MKKVDSCPRAELIAAGIEGRLQGEPRKWLLQHLLECGDCNIVFTETARLVDYWGVAARKRTWSRFTAAAAALLIVAFSAWMTRSWWSALQPATPAALLANLADAIGPERPTEGRLSIAQVYGPPGAFTRSGEGTRPLGTRTLEVTSIAGRIEQLASKDPSPQALHALGLAHLALGDLDAAVAALDRVLIPASRDPRVLSDLAAALLERGVRQDRPQDTVRALSVVEEALELDPMAAEARFNRALALEALHLRQRALQAWQRYLEIDPRSPWADEARRRMELLSAPSGAQLWTSERERLEAAALVGDAPTVREIVDLYRQPAREWMRDELLARWGAQVRDGDRAAAASTLAAAEVVARSHSEITDDPMSHDIVDSARAAFDDPDPARSRLHALAKAHEALAEARHALEAFHIDDARGRLQEAHIGFEAAGSPARLWAAQGLSVADYYRGDYDTALRRLGATRAEAEHLGYRALGAHVHWVTGLIYTVRSQLSEALSEYRRSLAAFQQVGDTGYTAFLMSLISEDLGYLADRSEEWRQREQALAGLQKYVPEQRAEVVLMEAAVATLEQGLPRVAFHFLEECLATALRRSDTVQVANALQWRAVIHYRLGRGVDALDDIREARSWTARIEDPNLRRRLESEVDYAAGLASSLQDPNAAHAELSHSLDYFRSIGYNWRLSELYLARGRVAIRRNDFGAAANDLLAGIRTFEEQRLSVVAAPQRISFFDTATELFDEAVALEVRRGNIAEALTLAERARARQLLETVSSRGEPVRADQIASRLPAGTALIFYQALPERLLAWVIVSGKVELVSTTVSMREHERLIADLQKSATDPSKADQARDDLSRLNRIVWTPVAPRLTQVPTLVFVPDKSLHLLPFAALLEEQTGKYLIESHEIVVAPSASIFLRALERQRQIPRSDSPGVLAVGDPSFDRATYPYLSRLAGASAEVDRIAGLYDTSLVLKKDSATKDAFLAAAGRYPIVHYAGHAMSHDVDPLRSRLILAPDPRAGNDGTLFAEEIYARRFPGTRLVVLAACSTASGWVSRGEGAMSLARPFLAAGVPAVIASLWDIEDKTGSEISLRLHRRLAAGAAPQEALRAAQLELIASDDPSLRAPGAWAALQMIGGSSPNETPVREKERT